MESRKVKILVIDDNKDNLITFEALIKEAFRDVVIFTAMSGKRGLELAATEDPDVILLDIVMPVMDGFEVCEKLKNSRNLSNIPVVFITAQKGDRVHHIRALEVGAEAFLSKPINESELTAQIRAMVAIKTARIERLNENIRLAALVKDRTLELKKTHTATLGLLEDLKNENEARKKSEEAAQASERKFRAVFEFANDAIFIMDKEMFVECNESTLPMFGCSDKGEIVYHSPVEFSPVTQPDGRKSSEKAVEFIQKAFDGINQRFYWKHSRKDRSEFDAEVSLNRFELDRKYVVQAIVRDVTERVWAEKKLKQASENWNKTFEAIQDGIALLDINQKVIQCNQIFLDFIDKTENEALGCYCFHYIHGSSCPIEGCPFVRMQQSKQRETMEMKIKGRECEIIVDPILDENKNIIGAVHIIADITERKRAEKALQESETSYRGLFNSVSEAIYVQDSSGHFLDVNQGAVMMYGYPKEFLIGKTPELVSAPGKNDLEAVGKAIQEAFKGKPQQFEFWGLRSNGEIFPKEIRLTKGTYFGKEVIFALARDITNRKKAEEEIRDSEQRHRDIFTYAPVGIYQTTKEGDFITLNDRLVEILGYESVEDLKQRNMAKDIYYDEEERRTLITKYKPIGDVQNVEVRWKKKDGTPVWIGLSVHTVKDTSNITLYFEGFVQDITERKQADREIRREKAFSANIVATVPESLLVVGRDLTIKSTNRAFNELFQTEPEKVMGSKIADMLGGDKDGKLSARLAGLFRTGDTLEDFELHYQSEKLGDRILNITVRGMIIAEEEEEEEEEVLVVMQDITERKRAEEALLESENKFRTIIEEAVEIVFITDNQGYFTYVNPAGLKSSGYSMEELTKLKYTDLIEPEYKQKVVRNYLRQYKQRMSLSNTEYPFRTKSGVIKWFNQNAQLIIENDEFKGFYVIARDVTERHLAEEAQRKSRQELLNFFEDDISADFFSTPDGKLLLCNKTFLKLFGFNTKEEALACPIANLYPNISEREKFVELIRKDKKVENYEIAFLSIDGRIINTLVNATGEFDDAGELIRIRGYILDITERKKLFNELIKAKERAEESDRLKSAFLANMSHEIRTPMNGILGFAELLKEPKLSGEEQQEYISVIQKSGNRMLNIINDIVNISKVEAGLVEVIVSETNINEQLEYIYTFFEPEVAQKGIHFLHKTKLAAKDAIIQTDREKIYSILTNLVKNAIKFTTKGTIELGCQRKGDYLQFFVKDTGTGIPKAQEDIIFDRFRQGSESLTRNYEGAGLGLSISKAFVEMLGGKIWVESVVGTGSTF
ncbi:MAG: PAS domain S-box protein, partial [Bacteroidales bacterium]|nr:PAS domain S-box protein [Bacteroidales bacterium]